MPDWFYRTVSRPLLFRLPAERARGFALGVVGGLARLPLGPAAIDFLGHMRADPRLRRSLLGRELPTAVGLGPWLDAEAKALPTLARFGVGFLEVGPVTVQGIDPSRPPRPVRRLPEREALWFPDPPVSPSLAAVAPRLAEVSKLGLPVILRIATTSLEDPERATHECCRLIGELAPNVHVVSLATLGGALAHGWSAAEWAAHLDAVLSAAHAASRPVLLSVPADLDLGEPEVARSVGEAGPFVEAAVAAGVAGLHLDGTVRAESGGRLAGAPAREPALATTRRLRERVGPDLTLVAAGGVHQPEDALSLLAAGADLVQVDSGLVYTGPGLPKWINDALLFAATREQVPESPGRAPERTWFWTALMGAGMLLGGLLAVAIAMTQVVLPYDEAYVGMARHELAAINARLLDFMAHDRVSLAGTMVSIGLVYLGLSLGGMRRGLHWAQQSVFVSAFTGFASFFLFLFLGFGYLDVFHAFVTACLFQILLMALHARLGTWTPAVPPLLREDRAWRRSLWGQLLLVLHGCGLLGAGAAISAIGVTEVFVPQDLEFMRTTAEALAAANPRLVPLVAHDRATFGGMLLASGWAFLLPALWGFRNGSAWLWRTLLLAGLPAYAGALGVHLVVGYTSVVHLLPVLAGLAVFLLGLGLSREYPCGAPAEGVRDARPGLAAQRPVW